MCGIAGELNWTVGVDVLAVNAMVSGIAHRGPDDRGLWSSPTGVCALGHARLSIVDLSPAGHQPMLDPLTGDAIGLVCPKTAIGMNEKPCGPLWERI